MSEASATDTTAPAAPRPILIGFDGSPAARSAVAAAARLFAGRPALVLVVWESIVPDAMAGLVPRAEGTAGPRGADELGIVGDVLHELDDAGRHGAETLAAEGAALAVAAGLAAEPRVERLHHAPVRRSRTEVAAALVAVADERDVELVVLGRRGLSSLREIAVGSVTQGVVHGARRPVLLVPHDEPERGDESAG